MQPIGGKMVVIRNKSLGGDSEQFIRGRDRHCRNRSAEQ